MLQSLKKTFKTFWNRPKVAHIAITNLIDHNTVHSIQKGLKQLDRYHWNTKAIFLTVNCKGGSSSQSLILTQKIKQFCKKKNIAQYTFAEEEACSAGYLVLSAGDKVYVENYSIVGSIGAIYQMWYFNKFLTKAGLEYKSYNTGAGNQSSLIDPFDKYNKKKVTTGMTKVVKYMQEIFVIKVKENRANISDSIKVEEGEIFSGKQAVELGQADEIGNYSSVLDELYPDAKVVVVGKDNQFQDAFKQFENMQIKSETVFLKKLQTLKVMKQKTEIKSIENQFLS